MSRANRSDFLTPHPAVTNMEIVVVDSMFGARIALPSRSLRRTTVAILYG